MSDRSSPKLNKWPFFFVDATLLGVAYLIFWQSKPPMTTWPMVICALFVALGAILAVIPFLLEYRAAMNLTEADRLTNALLQIQNLEIIGRQISGATANWQTAHEHSVKTVDAARQIAEGMATEARAFSEFLKNANDTEKNYLRLEVDKLRRGESEWLQILVRILDHIFALYQAAARSTQGNIVEQLGLFQNACRDIARRVGLVPFVAIPGEAYDPKLHQLADTNVVPAAEARVAETVATGYSFQGQLVRAALVTLQQSPTELQPPDPGPSADVINPIQVEAGAMPEGLLEQAQSAEAETKSPGALMEETPKATPPSIDPVVESMQRFLRGELPAPEQEGFRLL